MTEKMILKETVKQDKKRNYKPKTKKVIKTEEFKFLDNEFVMRANEIPNIKTHKQVGYYKIGKSFHIFFDEKPNLVHRFFTKLFLGWEWKNQK
jgi:hemerythrin